MTSDESLCELEDVFKIFACAIREEENSSSVCDRFLSFFQHMKINPQLQSKTQQQINYLISTLIEKTKDENIHLIELNKFLKCALFLILFLEYVKLGCAEKYLTQNSYSKPTLYLEKIMQYDISSELYSICFSFFVSIIPKLLFTKQEEEFLSFEIGECDFYELLYKLLLKKDIPSNLAKINLVMFQLLVIQNR